MANFSAKERIIASLLSATPGLKKVIKNFYIRLNSVIYRKGYLVRILDTRIREIRIPFGSDGSFGGYYDKSSINEAGCVIAHRYKSDTSKKPSAQNSVDILVKDLGGCVKKIGETSAYNWQQGARAHWIDRNAVIYNVFDGSKYCALLSDVMTGEIHKYDFPIQDSFERNYYLAINYRRIMAMRPDYGYRNLPVQSKDELKGVDDDGIWKVNFDDGHSELLLTLKEVIAFEPKKIFEECLHNVNHVMIKPDGNGFIFIHRWYHGKRRFDRLLYYDFNTLRVMADDSMVSHMCWVDDNTLFGYLRHDGKDGFYFINIISGEITPCGKLTHLGNGDGHPSVSGDWITFDTYPDKSRMQHLYLYNYKTDELLPLLELYHPVKYLDECRCDLHPRFAKDGKSICFDSVYKGIRNLCCIDVSQITNV